MIIEGEHWGIPMYEKIVAVKQGNYMARICAASYIENTTDDILSCFETA